MKKLIGSNSEFLFVAKSLEQRVRKLDENEFKLPRPRCFFRKKKNVARSPLLCPPPPKKKKKTDVGWFTSRPLQNQLG